MTKAQLIKILDRYNSDAEVEVKLPGEEQVWYDIVGDAHYVPHNPDHVLLVLTRDPSF